MHEAERSAQNEVFARSNKLRTFARCMGDDMETSTAGFADPFATGAIKSDVEPRRRTPKYENGASDEILWDESKQ